MSGWKSPRGRVLSAFVLGSLIVLQSACSGAAANTPSLTPAPLQHTGTAGLSGPSAGSTPSRAPTTATPSPLQGTGTAGLSSPYAGSTPSPLQGTGTAGLSGPDADSTPSRAPTTDASNCQEDWCAYEGHFWLERPVQSVMGDDIDPTYRYGSTENGTREAHSGVELQAPAGDSVHAAAGGVVVVAGGDDQAHAVAGNSGYGNVVILKHSFPGLDQPLFTLYAHLQEIDVAPGESVSGGQVIGKVGATGAATGPHLHFEVRLGGDTIGDTRNPELWFQPHAGEDSRPNGALAGQILNPDGSLANLSNVVLQYTRLQGAVALQVTYLQTYASSAQHGDDEWQENFAAGDLPAGWYRVTFVIDGGMIDRQVEVFPGRVSVLKVRVN
ncbi:MAG: peptidoglycan DD-metalloendopeptidase family protein [Chloroflexi bacterium]|nr:peptidoglycan DD-metalloendopeptidase family protein [Chloroflexota bacterium]